MKIMTENVTVYQMRLLDALPGQDVWVEVTEAEFNLPLKDPGQWEKRKLYTEQQSANKFTQAEHPFTEDQAEENNPLIKDARHCAFFLDHIGSMDADEIDGDTVELRFELDGIDTGADLSLTHTAKKSAALINTLLGKLAHNGSDFVTFEPVDLPSVMNALSSSTDWQKGFVEGQEHYRNEMRNIGPLFTVVEKELPHSDDVAFDAFALSCKAKLARSRAKGRSGWDNPAACSEAFLARLLVEHCLKGNAGTYEDIACLAMMLHQRNVNPSVLANEASQGRLALAESASRRGDQPLAHAYRELTPQFIKNYLSVFERYGSVPKGEHVVIQALRIALDGLTRLCAPNTSALSAELTEFFTAEQNSHGQFELSENCMCAIAKALESGFTLPELLREHCAKIVAVKRGGEIEMLAHLFLSGTAGTVQITVE